MAGALIAVSFVCAVFLAVFLPVKRIYSDIPSLAIVLWLLLANILQGVNSSLFLNTVQVSSFAWCDISTKLLLGVNVAIPGAYVCIGRRLELVSSPRTIPSNPVAKRNIMIFEIVMCYIFPAVYMCLHLIAQYHRFDIIQDFGCFAAVHPSTPGVVLVWVFPLILAAISILLSGLAIKNSLRLSTAALSAYLESRTTMSPSHFSRRATASIVISCICFITTLFSIFSVPTLIPWISWADVHAAMGRAFILTPEEISGTRLRWWFTFALSVAYIVLSFAIGEEARDSYRWLKSGGLSRDGFFSSLKQIRMPRRPLHSPRSQGLASKQSLPHMVELKSGWDDMVDFKPTSTKSTWPSLKQPRSSRSNTPSSPLASPVTSRSPSAASIRGDQNVTGGPMTIEDQAFMDSTISYLGSPTAQTLGITLPPRSLASDHLIIRSAPSPVRSPPPPTLVIPRRAVPPLSLVIADPVLPRDTPEFPTPATGVTRSPAPPRPGKSMSSVIRADWPVPPETPSRSSVISRNSSRMSTSHSPTSSIEEVAEYARYRSASPSSHSQSSHGRPFEDLFYRSPEAVYGQKLHHQQSVSALGGRSPSLKQSLLSLRESWNRENISRQSHPDGIVMTVVQETA